MIWHRFWVLDTLTAIFKYIRYFLLCKDKKFEIGVQGFMQRGLYNDHGELSSLLSSCRTCSQGAWGPYITAWGMTFTLAQVCGHDLGSNLPSYILMSNVSAWHPDSM